MFSINLGVLFLPQCDLTVIMVTFSKIQTVTGREQTQPGKCVHEIATAVNTFHRAAICIVSSNERIT